MLDIDKYANGELLFDGQYKLLRRLSGAGGTADVWLALAVNTIDTLGDFSEEDVDSVNEETGMKVAIKIYRLQNILDVEGEQRFKDEFKIVYNCHHSNILPTSHFSIFEDAPYLVMPYCKEGSSEKLVGKIDDAALLWKYLHDVSSGLSYLHSCNPPIVHQDIKPANILIDNNGNFAITDFGISAKKESGVNSYYDDSSSGTLVYMAPERFADNAEPLPESDIWALGATLYEIVTGDVPFGDRGGLAQIDGDSLPAIRQDVPKEIKKIIASCLDKDPKKRPTARRIVELIAERSLRKRKIKLYVLLAVALLVTGLSFMFIKAPKASPFDELCNSGDSIVAVIKNDALGGNLVMDDDCRFKLINAMAFYNKALTFETDNKERIVSVEQRVNTLDSLMLSFERYSGICDTIAITVEMGMPIKNAEYNEKKRSLVDEMNKKIIAL